MNKVNKFELCRMAVLGTRSMHRPGTRIEHTIKASIRMSAKHLTEKVNLQQGKE